VPPDLKPAPADNGGVGRETVQRLFFALWPDEPVRRALCERANAIVPAQARAVPCANLHLTLAFPGAVTAHQRIVLEKIAGAVSARPFVLTIDEAGMWRRKGIAWIGCRNAPAALEAIITQLRAGLPGVAIQPDDRPFAVHITIARNAKSPLRMTTREPLDWPVREFALMRSISVPGGVMYEPLRVWTLT